MINVGRLRKRINIYEWGESTNEMGHTVTGLKLLKTVWAEIHPYRGKEIVESNMKEAIGTYKITIRYFKDLTEEMYIEYLDSQYEIESISDLEMAHHYMELLCKINKKKKPKIEDTNDRV